MNRWFSPEEFGLRIALLDIAMIYLHLAHLGSFRSLTKFFPYFKKHDNDDDQGLFTIGFLSSLVGFVIIGCLLFIFKGSVINAFITKSPLLVDYFWAILPLSFLFLSSELLDVYLQARSQTVFSSFLKNVLIRVITTILLLLFHFQYIDFKWFIIFLISSYGLNVILFLGYLKLKKQLYFKINFQLFSKRFRKVYFNYSLFIILSGISGVLTAKIDSLMISSFLGLHSVAIYANAIFLTALIYIPSNTIAKIALPILAKDWKEKKIGRIKKLYQQSSINQLLFGGGIFILLYSNIDSLFAIQRPEYSEGKNVLLMLGIARALTLSAGVNSMILSVSKYYRYDTITVACLGVFTVITNYIFIPIWGVEGAAFATAFSIIVFNSTRVFIVYKKIGIQPFSGKTGRLFLILGLAFASGFFLPKIDNLIIDVIVRSIVIFLFVGIPSYYFEISEDLNRIINKYISKITNREQAP